MNEQDKQFFAALFEAINAESTNQQFNALAKLIHNLYGAFVNNGFTDEQAFELTKVTLNIAVTNA